MVTGNNTGRRVKTVQTAFQLLETIRDSDGISLTALTNEHDTSKSTVYHHLKTLHELGYVYREGNEYYLGLGLLAFGKQSLDRLEITQLLEPETRELAEEVDGRAVVMVGEGARGYLVYQHRTENSVMTDTDVGETIHLHCTAVGKAYLSAIHEPKRKEIVQEIELIPETENTITSRQELYEELDRTSERGYSTNDEERIEGMRSVGAPIVTESGSVLGSISVSLPITRLKDEQFQSRIPTLVRETASVIAIKKSYQNGVGNTTETLLR